MSNIERWLSDAFPTWVWTVTGARDEATARGLRDGFEPVTLEIRITPRGTVRVWLDVGDCRRHGEGESVKEAVQALDADVGRAKARFDLFAASLRSMRARPKKAE